MSLESVTKLAELTGVNRAKVSKILEDLPYTARKNAKLYDSVQALRVILGGGGEFHDLAAERARLTHHQANVEELKEAEMRGDLIRRDLISEEWRDCLLSARSVLLALPGRLANKAIAANSLKEIEEAARAEVYTALEAMSNDLGRSEDPSDSGRRLDAMEAAAADDGQRVGGKEEGTKRRSKRGAGKVAKRKGAAPGQADGRTEPVGPLPTGGAEVQ